MKRLSLFQRKIKTAIFISFALLILLQCNGNEKVKKQTASKIYIYSDGSGNAYKVYKKENGYFLDFNPVQPDFISSGNYSGGKKAQMKVSLDFYKKTANLFNKAFNNESIHLEKRVMTSGFIKIKNGHEKSVIIHGSTNENLEIKTHLSSVLGK